VILRKLELILLIACLFTFMANGQKGYFVTDSSRFIKQIILDGGDEKNARYCQVKEGDKAVLYSPEQVKEYGSINRKKIPYYPILCMKLIIRIIMREF
jgi:hypothetical protein